MRRPGSSWALRAAGRWSRGRVLLRQRRRRPPRPGSVDRAEGRVREACSSSSAQHSTAGCAAQRWAVSIVAWAMTTTTGRPRPDAIAAGWSPSSRSRQWFSWSKWSGHSCRVHSPCSPMPATCSPTRSDWSSRWLRPRWPRVRQRNVGRSGLQRAEILAALANAVMLTAIAGVGADRRDPAVGSSVRGRGGRDALGRGGGHRREPGPGR